MGDSIIYHTEYGYELDGMDELADYLIEKGRKQALAEMAQKRDEPKREPVPKERRGTSAGPNERNGDKSAFYNTATLAELLGCSRETICEHNRKGLLPLPCNVGSTRPKWRKTDIDLWIANDCKPRAKFEQIKQMERSRKK